MIETRRLKNVVIFVQTILSFVLSRKIINIYNDIARKYGNVTVKDFRKYEKLEYKKNKLKLDIDFLNNCKQLGVYPKFLIFKLPNVSNKDALSIRKRLLRSAINKRNKELQQLSKELSLSVNFLSTQLSTIDFYILTNSITSYNKKSLQKSLYTQQKKLSSLTKDCNLPIFTANETITNLTQYELSQEESDLLKAGLYFSIQPDKIRKSEIFTTFEKIHRSFLNNLKSEETKSQIKAHLSYLANSYFYNYKPSPRILRQHRVLRNLRKNKDIVITKPDKGNGVVILDRKLYNNAIEEIISDSSKFEKLNEDPTLKREASLQRFLRKLKQKNFFNEIEYDKLYPSGSAPARIYGTPKMHKFYSSDSFPKLRPIVSSIGTFNYNLASFLCDLLSPLVPNDHSCKDTFSFVSQIKNANLSKKFLVSYDVTSLFTNIPLQEIIDIAINLLFNHNPNLNITRKELKKLFLFATSKTHFIFNSKFYNQIDGVAMGSPLAPVLANIFMGFHESKWLNEYNLNKPKFYLRYVDDILAAFDNEHDSLNFLNFLNNRHLNIKFTIEKQNNHSIAFLDVLISGINNQNLTLQTYHKSTYTGLLLNFKSFTSFSYKISLVKCLIDKSFKICNNWTSFHNDIENIKSNLIKNAYPPFLIDKIIKKYLNYKFSCNPNQLKDKSDVHYFKLPYIGNLSHHIKNKLSKLCKEFCKENFNIKLVFNSFKIKNYFSYKDPIPNDLKSFLVYKFTCASCSSSYIGETCRHFKTRIEEHIKKDNKSHIFKHLHSSETCFDSYNSLCFEIIDKANSKFDLKIIEALHIN